MICIVTRKLCKLTLDHVVLPLYFVASLKKKWLLSLAPNTQQDIFVALQGR